MLSDSLGTLGEYLARRSREDARRAARLERRAPVQAARLHLRMRLRDQVIIPAAALHALFARWGI